MSGIHSYLHISFPTLIFSCSLAVFDEDGDQLRQADMLTDRTKPNDLDVKKYFY